MPMTTGGGGKKGRTKSRGGKVIPISGATSGFTRLKALRCFKEVHQRLVEGWPLTELARWIQDDQKEYVGVTKSGLISVLQKYKTAIPAAEFAKKNPAINPTVIDRIKEVEEGLNELEEMEKLYRLQMERVQIDRVMEQNIKKLLPTMGQEIRTAKEILQAYADLKMDLGIVDRNLGTQRTETVTATINFDNPSVQKVFDDPDKRRRLGALAQRFLAASTDLPKDEVAHERIVEAEFSASDESESESGEDA